MAYASSPSLHADAKERDNNKKKLVLSIQSKVCIISPCASETGSSAYVRNTPRAPPPSSLPYWRGCLTTQEPTISILKCAIFNTTYGNIDAFIWEIRSMPGSILYTWTKALFCVSWKGRDLTMKEMPHRIRNTKWFWGRTLTLTSNRIT